MEDNNENFSYDSFYDAEQQKIEDEENQNKEKKDKLKKKILTIIILVLVLILIVILILFIKSKNTDYIESVVISDTLENGTTLDIDISDSNVTDVEYSTSDYNIVTFNGNELQAVGDGTTDVTITYKYKGIKHTKKYTVKVETTDPEANNATFKVTGYTDSKFVNTDVTLKLTGSVDKFTYTIDGGSEINVSNKQIVISEEGKHEVVIYSYKGSGKESKTLNIYIDKTKPEVSLSSSNVYTGKTDLEVCAKCTDTLSGCVKETYCTKFTESKSNQTITVKDKAGNSIKSESFNISINKESISCSLKVTDNVKGTITATTTGTTASKKGFKSDYSDDTTTTTVSKAGTVTFYAQTAGGVTTTCSLDVKVKTQYRSRSITKTSKCSGSDYSKTCGTSKPCNPTTKDPISGTTTCDSGYKYSSVSKKCVNCSTGKAKTTTTTYGDWSAYSDTKVTESSTLDVETRNYYYS